MQNHHTEMLGCLAIGMLLGHLIGSSHLPYMELILVLVLIVLNYQKIGQCIWRFSIWSGSLLQKKNSRSIALVSGTRSYR